MKCLLTKLAPFIVLAAGILFIVLGFGNVNKQKAYTETTATISDISSNETVLTIGDVDDSDEENETHVFVKYTVDGKEYETELGEYSSSMKVGNTVNIRYNPDNPTDIVKSGVTTPIILFSFGGVAILCGIVLIIKKFI